MLQEDEFSDVPTFEGRLKPVPASLVPTSTVDEFLGAIGEAKDEADRAIAAIQRAACIGFVCDPQMLQQDPWLASVRTHADFDAVLTAAVEQTTDARPTRTTSPSSADMVIAGTVPSG